MNYILNNQEDNPVLNNEIWVEIEDLPYELSSNGTVRRKKSTAYDWKNKTHVKPYINNKGYMCIHLYKNSKCHRFQIHRLLAQYFIPNPNNLPEVNHIDGNPLNNSLENLEWVTHQQNIQHAHDTGLFKINRSLVTMGKRKNSSSKYHGVSWSNQRQKWCVGVSRKGKRYTNGRYKDEIEAAKAYDALILKLGFDKLGYKLNFI